MGDQKLRIVGFLCNWCSYAGADLAGVSRLQMPPTLRVVRVMCSGSLDPQVVITAFKEGVDGAIIMGCHPGDCHYLSGNYEALRKYNMLKKILALTDFEEERLKLEWVSASEGSRFQKVIIDFTDRIRKLGPNPLQNNDDFANKIQGQLDAVIHAVSRFRLRSVVGREKKVTELGNAYGETFSQEEIDEIKDQIFEDEYIRSNILLMLEKGEGTVEEISDSIGVPADVVFRHVARLWKKQIILPAGHKEASPTYMVAGGV